MTLLDQIRARGNPDALLLAEVIEKFRAGVGDPKCRCHICENLRPLYTPLTVTAPLQESPHPDTMRTP